jgi:hypothetical protein
MNPFKNFIFLGFFFLLVLESSGQTAKLLEKKDFPEPKDVKNLLFYVQRTINTNTLIYSLNLNDKKELNEKTPIKIYWIDYASDSRTEPLNYIQLKYAYGIDIQLVDNVKKVYCFNFVSYKKKQIFLMKSPVDNSYKAYSLINNKLIVLESIFIKMEVGNFWTPKVEYIDVTGRDQSKNEVVTERIIP